MNRARDDRINISSIKKTAMHNIQLDLNKNGQGAFYIGDGEERMGEMAIAVGNDSLTVYHTEVSPKAEGKGFAKELLGAMVAYARENKLSVVPLCPYVHAQFKRHPADYADVWQQQQS
jgi:predicted GNAT family acetyltransferase